MVVHADGLMSTGGIELRGGRVQCGNEPLEASPKHSGAKPVSVGTP